MLDLNKGVSCCLRAGYTDLRKGVEGLLGVLAEHNFDLEHGFNDKTLFLFCGRRADRYKALYWDGRSFVLLYKRLGEGRFNWPRSPEGLRYLTMSEFLELVETPGGRDKVQAYEVCPYQLF